MCRMRKTLPGVLLTESEFRRQLCYLAVGAIQAVTVGGEPQRDFTE